MLKRILVSILILYVVVTSAYFVNKFFPFMDKMFSAKKEAPTASDTPDTQACPSFSIGHISGSSFRINSRFKRSVKDHSIDENDLQNSIAENTCDRAGQTALIYYDSRPVALASVESYDYSKPLGSESKEKPIVYTVMTTQQKLDEHPDNGYVVAVFDYNDKLMDFYKALDTSSNTSDEELIGGSVDTIYYQVVGQDPSSTDVEYSSLKTELNSDGIMEIAVVASWEDKKLPKGTNYVAAFNLHLLKGKTSRYPLYPMSRMKKSKLYLFQAVDVDNDGYKETILRKDTAGQDEFIIYRYDPNKDGYTELSL